MACDCAGQSYRSEEHTSELQSLTNLPPLPLPDALPILATFGSRARAMRPGLFLPEATPVKHSPAGTLTLVPAYPPRNRPASTWRKPSRQRNVDETWPATARGNRIDRKSTRLNSSH